MCAYPETRGSRFCPGSAVGLRRGREPRIKMGFFIGTKSTQVHCAEVAEERNPSWLIIALACDKHLPYWAFKSILYARQRVWTACLSDTWKPTRVTSELGLLTNTWSDELAREAPCRKGRHWVT